MSSISYVVFTKSTNHWIRWFLNRKIGHCFTITPERGRWLVCDRGFKELSIYTVDDYYDLLQGSYVIKYPIQSASRGLFMLDTCVGQVKQRLGIKKPFIWTPYQLYKYLRGQNAKP